MLPPDRPKRNERKAMRRTVEGEKGWCQHNPDASEGRGADLLRK